MIWEESVGSAPAVLVKKGGESLSPLETSELRYRRLFETAQDGILILNGETGKIVDVNPFLLDLLDYPFESIIGLELWQIGLFDDILQTRRLSHACKLTISSATRITRYGARTGKRSKSNSSATPTYSRR